MGVIEERESRLERALARRRELHAT